MPVAVAVFSVSPSTAEREDVTQVMIWASFAPATGNVAGKTTGFPR